MKIYIPLALFAGLLIASCSTSKFQASFSEDKPLFAAINQLIKKPENLKAQEDLKKLYTQSVERHEESVNAYRSSSDMRKWDNILAELGALQKIYSSIQSTPGALEIISPKSYQAEIEEMRLMAAEDHYRKGMQLLALNGLENSRQAYAAFRKTSTYIKGYKDSDQMQREAYERGTVHVVVNPVEQDNLFFSNFRTINTSFSYRPEEFQQNLVRDLGNRSSSNMAKFYTSYDARRLNLDPDWIVDINWRNLDVLNSMPRQFNRQVSKNIQIGTDTSGKAIMKTVHGTLRITERVFTVRGNLDYRIMDIQENELVDQGLVMNDVSWTDSYASFTGDARALSDNDRYLLNRSSTFRNPSRGEVMNALMQKAYPEVARRIENAVRL